MYSKVAAASLLPSDIKPKNNKKAYLNENWMRKGKCNEAYY